MSKYYMPLKCLLKFKLQNRYFTNGMGVFVVFVLVIENITLGK